MSSFVSHWRHFARTTKRYYCCTSGKVSTRTDSPWYCECRVARRRPGCRGPQPDFERCIKKSRTRVKKKRSNVQEGYERRMTKMPESIDPTELLAQANPIANYEI